MTTEHSDSNIFSQMWNFFASVQLAIVTLCTISLASIAGTIIPQKEALSWYANKYSPQFAQFLDLTNCTDLFGSVWFRFLIALLGTNLIICSIDRFPRAWDQITADNLSFPIKRLFGIKRNESWTVPLSLPNAVDAFSETIKKHGWSDVSVRETEEGILLFSQKGKWTRLGVFIVHSSILVILFGSMIGTIFGFNGTISLPEGQETNKVLSAGTFIDLGFDVRCDSFSVDYYPNGMPKEYRSLLTVLEKGKEILHKAIKVNKPLTYKGITFYQASYEAYKDFIISISDEQNNKREKMVAPFQKQMEWKEEGVRLGIINAESIEERATRIKIWFADRDLSPSVFWVEPGKQIDIDRNNKHYQLTVKQMYATGLQVAKDPGIIWIYIGCFLILSGLYVTFFMSHQKIWILISSQNAKTQIFMAGKTNKNKTGFDAAFSKLVDLLKNRSSSI